MQIGRFFRRTQERARREVNIAVPMAAGAFIFGAIVLVSWPHVGRPSRAAAVPAAATFSEVTVIPPSAAEAPPKPVPVERSASDVHPAPKPSPQKGKLAVQRSEDTRGRAVVYRNCLPACETRDRLTRQAAAIVLPAPAPEAVRISAQPAVLSPSETVGDAIIRGGSEVFVGIVSAPATAMDAGRQVVDGALRFIR